MPRTAAFSQLVEAQKSLAINDPLLREGVCAACSILWVKYVIAGFTSGACPDPQMRMELLQRDFNTVVNNQRSYGKEASDVKDKNAPRPDVLTRTDNALSKVMMFQNDAFPVHTRGTGVAGKLKLGGSDLDWSHAQHSAEYEKEIFKPGTYHLLLFSFTDDKGKRVRHSIASACPSGAVGVLWYFDPNEGEFVVTSVKDFQAGMAAAARVYGENYAIKTLRLLEVCEGYPSISTPKELLD